MKTLRMKMIKLLIPLKYRYSIMNMMKYFQDDLLQAENTLKMNTLSKSCLDQEILVNRRKLKLLLNCMETSKILEDKIQD